MSFKVTCVVFDISLLYFLSGKMSFDFPFGLVAGDESVEVRAILIELDLRFFSPLDDSEVLSLESTS